MKLAIAGDSAGLPLVATLLPHLRARAGLEVCDLSQAPEGTKEFYANLAERVALAVRSGEYDRGILICGTGIGMSMAANKIPNIRAAACSEPYSAILSRRHNNSNVLCMGARVVASGLATLITEGWLNASYEGERHQRRVDMLTRIEQRYSIPAVPHVTKEDDTNPIHPAETPTSE